MALNPAQVQRSTPWRTFVRLAKASKRYIGWYIALGVICALSALTNIASIEALRRIVDAAVDRSSAGLLPSFAYAASGFGGGALLDFIKCVLTARLEQGSVMAMQVNMVRKAQRVSQSFMDKNQSGDVITRIMDNAGTAQAALNNTCVDIVMNVLRVAFLLAYLINLDWRLTIGTVVLSLSIPGALLPLSKYIKRIWDEFWKTEGELSSIVQDGIQGAETVKAYQMAPSLVARFIERYSFLLKRIVKAECWSQASNLVVWTLLISGIFFVLGYGGSLVAKGVTTIGTVTVYLVSFEQISFPLNSVLQAWPNLQKALGAADRVFEFMDAPEQSEGWGDITIPVEAGSDLLPIAFEGVCFGYSEDRPVLDNLSFVAEPGEVTAIVGESGSGKSTILKLLAGIYRPDSGVITLGGEPLTKYSLESWRKHIGYVSQEVSLFSMTIFENIAQGRLGASREDVIRAAKAANCDEFVESLKHGYDASIGEKGVMLSGGQKQRIAIARAILRKPSLLLLDEATSALDNESERAVQEALERFCKGRTTIVVAHRLSTIMGADKIIFLEGGKAVEEGTHEELMAKNGKYRRMFVTAYGEREGVAI